MSATRNLSPLVEEDIKRSSFPRPSIGKSCIRFKRLGDVDQEVLERLLRNVAEARPPSA